jgi:L-iditol 2-dehydrogenase
MPFVLPGVVKIPACNTFEEGAMLEPVNTVLKAVKRLNLLRGDSVLVAGQGPIGLMFTKILSLQGIRVVATDLMENRVKLALEWGAEKSFDAGDKDAASKIRSAFPVLDAAIITVPSTPVVHEAIELVRGSAQVLLFAHTRKGEKSEVDFASICLDEKDLIGSYSSDFTLQKEVARLVFSRRLDVRGLITHRFPLSQTSGAVALASKPTPDSLKVVTFPPGDLLD